MPEEDTLDFFVQWHLTERCNLRCRHCYQSGNRADELSLAEIRDVIDEVSETVNAWSDTHQLTFSPSFNITGGEPFLRQDLFEIIEDIGKKGFGMFLLTNGTLVTEERAVAVAGRGVKGVQVSMEGPEKIHDTIRGMGSFRSSVEGIKHLIDAGIPVTLNATLSNLNAPHMNDMVSIAASLGVQRLGFSRLVPSGRGMKMVNELLSQERVKELYSSLLSQKINGLEIVTGDPVAAQMDLNAGADIGYTAFGGCAAGVSGITILSDGTMTPCRRLDIPIGNIRKDSLREVWATSEVLAALRDRNKYQGKCGKCSRWANCRGCRAIAYSYSRSKGEGDFLAEDPQCFLAAE